MKTMVNVNLSKLVIQYIYQQVVLFHFRTAQLRRMVLTCMLYLAQAEKMPNNGTKENFPSSDNDL